MVTECVLIGFVCLFVITFVCLLLEHFRAQKWEQEGDRLKSRMSELETIISAQGVKILEVQEKNKLLNDEISLAYEKLSDLAGRIDLAQNNLLFPALKTPLEDISVTPFPMQNNSEDS